MPLLDITNYGDHPEEPNWLVFRYGEVDMANEMEVALAAASLEYERDNNEGPPYLIGVRKRDRDLAVRLNYTVLGRHRPRFISDNGLRWTILIVVLLMVLLAIAGAVLKH